MLADPLTIRPLVINSAAVSVGTTESYAVIDLSPGRSVRICSATNVGVTYPGKLTIAHSVSNENKPVKTDRILVRFDNTCYNEAGQELNAYAYAVFGLPHGATDSNQDALGPMLLVQQLCGLLAVSPSANTLSSANMLRVLAGEP